MKSIPLLILFATGAHASVLFYDSQSASSVYNNTSYSPSGLTYTMANSQALPVNDGKRVSNGLGDTGGNDYFSLTLTTGGAWDQAGLYDSGSQTVGGGSVSGAVYMGVLVRAQNAAGAASENKAGAPQGSYAAFQLNRPSVTTLGVGNYWTAWAYSIFGVAGDRDLIQGSGGSSWLNYDTTAHWMVAKITFNAGAADDISVWLDPNPDDLDSQQTGVRRYTASAVGDLSFNEIAYRSGNLGAQSSWEFDESRFAMSWSSLTAPIPEAGSALLLGSCALGFVMRRRKNC